MSGPLPHVPPESTTEQSPQPLALDWLALSGAEPPARQWAVKGWLGYGHVTLLIGTGGIGKTLIAQQIGSCLAIGRSPFIDDIPGQAKVLMWACEDDHDELWRRQVSISHWLSTGIESFSDFVLMPRHGCENALCTAEFGKLMFTTNIALLREQAMDLKARVVILDNVAQLYGANENDRHSVTAFQNALSGALPGLAILLLGHPSRGAGSEFSGSSAWENVARTRLYLGATLPDQRQGDEEPTDSSIRYLARRKGNYSERDWRRCIYKDGVLVPEIATGGVVDAIRTANCEKVVMAGITSLATKKLFPTDAKTAGDRYLPKMLCDYSLNDKFQKHELTAAMRQLLMDGRIERAQVDRTASRHPIHGLMVK